MQYYTAITKMKILPFVTNMDGLGDYYAKKNKPVREKQTPYDLIP